MTDACEGDIAPGRESWARLRTLFDAALDIPARERNAWIFSNVADDAERQALTRLVAADAGADGFLDTPIAEHASRLTPDSGLAESLIGQRIGAFRLVRLLGKGGMAAVFLGAREDGDFRQHVAIKLLRRGLYSEVEQRLFLRERQVLASLSHPNIARLFDGGVTQAGIPYLVMEYVDGEPITHYASAHALGVDARLDLLLTVCRAVEAAHHALIVHRDIKPSNILVASDGTVKLLDFGIAKLLEDDADGGTIGVFTPDYAAPEQIAAQAVTTATDVYALGVLLHELLLGARPARPARRPSALVTGSHAPDVRPLPPPALRKILRGDLDNILLKALAAEPEQRYASAGALADDIARYRTAQPVLAHPPSPWYRARKFVRRHRMGAASTLVFAIALFGAFGATLWQARIARSEARRAGEVQTFIEELFTPLEEGTSPAKAPSIQDLLKRGLDRVEGSFPDDDRARADVLAMFARINDGVGEIKGNLDLSQAAYRANVKAYGPDDVRTLDARAMHARVLRRLEKYDDALAEYAAVRAAMEARGIRNVGYASVLDAIGITLEKQGHPGEALALKKKAVEVREADADAKPDELASGYNQLGVAYDSAHDYERALELYKKSYDLDMQAKGENLAGATSLANIGNTYSWMGRWHDAAATLEQARAMYARIGIGDHSNLMSLLIRLCDVDAQSESPQAASVCDDAVAMAERVHGQTHSSYAMALVRRAGANIHAGDLDAADADLAQARAIFTRIEGTTPSWIAQLDAIEAGSWRLRGDYAAMREHLAGAVGGTLGVDHPTAPLNFAWFALACARAPDDACGSDSVARADEVLARPAFARHPYQLPAATALAEIDLAHGDAARAIARIEKGLAIAAAELGEKHSWIGEAHLALGDARAAMGDESGARAEYARAAAVIDALPPAHPLHERIASKIAR